MAKVDPITPGKARELRAKLANDEVIAIVNDLLVKRFSDSAPISISIEEIMDAVLTKYSEDKKDKRRKAFQDNKEGNVENFYRSSGWEVKTIDGEILFYSK